MIGSFKTKYRKSSIPNISQQMKLGSRNTSVSSETPQYIASHTASVNNLRNVNRILKKSCIKKVVNSANNTIFESKRVHFSSNVDIRYIVPEDSSPPRMVQVAKSSCCLIF